MNLRPLLVLVAIAAMLIGFIYWREHAAPAVKKERPGAVKVMAPKPAAPQVKRRQAGAPDVHKAAATIPAPALKAHKAPKVAIVIDDFGYNMNNVRSFLELDRPITFSVLPHERYTKEVADMVRAKGGEAILHLPLESWRNDVKEEAVTIRSGMKSAEIGSKLKKEIGELSPINGVSNHMGSEATEDRELMREVLGYIKDNDLYFLDSLTSPRSVCREVASELGVKYARRDRFLDNDNSVAAIEKQLYDVKRLAISRGRAIAVGHDRKNTAEALAKTMPEMARDGIEFVYLSEMVE